LTSFAGTSFPDDCSENLVDIASYLASFDSESNQLPVQATK